MKQFTGTTESAEAPILGADFWKPETEIEGQVSGSYQTQNGIVYELELNKPVAINGHDSVTRVCIGNLSGFQMAVRASGCGELQDGDAVIIKCTSVSAPKQKGYSPRPNFQVTVGRA